LEDLLTDFIYQFQPILNPVGQHVGGSPKTFIIHTTLFISSSILFLVSIATSGNNHYLS